MPTTITFKGRTPILCDSVIARTQTTFSSEDVMKTAVRPVIDIKFPSSTDYDELISIFASKDETLSEISIERKYQNPKYVDDVSTPGVQKILTETFVHVNYNIPLELTLKNVDDINMWVMSLAQLTPSDIAMRELSGRVAKKTDFLTFEEYQQALIEQSNDDLAKFLSTHPLISSCHEGIFQKYNATLEHQFLFTSNFMAHYVKVQAGLKDDVFRWNASGETCVPWTDAEALLFITDMSAYVTPLVEAQQLYEKKIRVASTKEELDQIFIDYSAVETVNKPIHMVGYTDSSYPFPKQPSNE